MSGGAKKVALFGLLGAVGCLVGCLLGEALLRAALPGDATSLASTPEPPALKAADAQGAAAPELPRIVPPTPVKPSADFDDFYKRTGAQSGEVQISLRWYNHDDLDLHCVDPFGERIFYRHKIAEKSKGKLDVDENAGPPLQNNPGENIRWRDAPAPLGKYKVSVVLFNRRVNSPTRFKVRIVVDDQVEEFDDTITRPSEERFIKEFEVKPRLSLAAAPELVVNQDDKNVLPIAVARTRFARPLPVTLRVDGDLDGVAIKDATIAADASAAQVEVAAEANARPGTRHLRVTARSGDAEAKTTFRLQIKEPPRALRLSTPSEVRIRRGTSEKFKVLIARDFFRGPVELRWEGLANHLTAPDGLTALPGDSSETHLTLAAGPDADEGARELTLVGIGPNGAFSARQTLKVVVVPAGGWSWLTLLVIGLWTALLAVGLALALVIGQNRYLGRPALPGSQARGVIGGALLAGLAAGVVGQSLFGLLSGAQLLPQLGFLVGWGILGALVGRGLVFFIANLEPKRATLAGGIGGLLGALPFLLAPADAALARFVAAGILGAAIGLVVVLVEMTFRRAWLQVQRGPREVVTVNLGERTVSIGSDGKACTVYVMGVAPVAYRYRLLRGQVTLEDAATGLSQTVGAGHHQKIGTVEVTVCGEAGGGPPPPPPPPPAPVPVRKRPGQEPPPPGTPGGCPKCGLTVSGQPGSRHCFACDVWF